MGELGKLRVCRHVEETKDMEVLLRRSKRIERGSTVAEGRWVQGEHTRRQSRQEEEKNES
jgi:hypothetical protein